MRRLGRAVAVLLALGPALLAPGGAALAASAPSNGDATRQFGGCLAEQKKGDVLLLLDQSGSLRRTDPQDGRVRAATFLVQQLARTAGAARVQLDVAVAGFDTGYQRTVDWQPLDSRTLPGVVQGVQAYADRDSGFDTDYPNALAGARDELRARQREDADRCRAVVWFTDGDLDVEVRRTDQQAQEHGTTKPYAPGADLRQPAGAQQAEQAGTRALCEVGGIADQLRGADVLTFAVGLGAQEQFGLLRDIATGSGGSPQGCGKQPAGVVGAFERAADVRDLVFAFNRALSVVPPDDRTTPVCIEVACPGAARRFVLDASIRTVDVLAGSTAPGVDFLLTGPGGGPATRVHFSRAGTQPAQSVSGQRLQVEWLEQQQVHLVLQRQSDAGWAGQWTLVPVAPRGTPTSALARTQITISGDLVPALAPGSELRAERDARVPVVLVSQTDGKQVPAASVLGTAKVSARLIAGDGTEVRVVEAAPLRDVVAGAPVDLSQFPPGPATLRMRLAVRTAGTTVAGRAVPGTQLEQRQADVAVDVLPPAEFPRVTQRRLELGEMEGPGPFPGKELQLGGSGCVWLTGARVDSGPQGSGARVTSPASGPGDCVTLTDGGRLPLTVEVAEQGNGTLSGVLSVALAPKGHPERALTTTVPFVGDLVGTRDASVLGTAFVVALLLGLGLPLAFLYLMRWYTARIPGEALRVGTLPVTLVGPTVQRGGGPFRIDLADDTRFLPVPPGGTRTLQVEGLTLQTRTGLSPAAEPWTEVTAAGSVVVTDRGDGRLPLGVHGSWVAVLDPGRPDAARVVVLLPTDASPGLLDQVSREVQSRLPELARAAAVDAPAGPQAGGGTGAPPAPGGFSPPPPPPTRGSGPGAPGGGFGPPPGPPPGFPRP